MHVIVFDEENEEDLMILVNEALYDYQDKDIIDIKYSVAMSSSGGEQFYCFSCMIICKD